MPDHDVRLTTKNLEIKGINLEFAVEVDGAVLGTLAVSEGSLEWTPKRGRQSIPISWVEFKEWAES